MAPKQKILLLGPIDQYVVVSSDWTDLTNALAVPTKNGSLSVNLESLLSQHQRTEKTSSRSARMANLTAWWRLIVLLLPSR